MVRSRGRVVIVGGGLAGGRAAAELRAAGFAGAIVLLAAEPHEPYERPPLSKQVLLGAPGAEAEAVRLDLPWRDLGVDLRLGCRATGLRPGAVATSDGEIGYDGLVIATGAAPRRLPTGGGQVLRTLEEARALRSRLRPGARGVVVGAGWIGAEVATAAAARGCAVTVVEAGAAPLAAALGEVGAVTAGWYADSGVRLIVGATVAAVEPDGVLLATGEHLPSQVTVVGIGAEPDVGWLVGSGLELEGGVRVDEHLAASWPGVVAVGDCASWWSRRFATRLRVEHWDQAMHSPAVAAATLLGRPAVHDPVPYFWSEQFGRMVQFAGYAAGADRLVWRGDPAQRTGWAACWLRDGELVALLSVDRPRDLLQARRRIAAHDTPDPDRLADPAVPVRDA